MEVGDLLHFENARSAESHRVREGRLGPHVKRRSCRAIWISDLHLGTPRCKAAVLLDFLQHHEAETLFLLGDIVDGVNWGASWYWDAMQAAVVTELQAWGRRGTHVVYIPGNHDIDMELAERLLGIPSGPIETTHRTLDGRRMLVTHGHLLDPAVACTRWWQSGSTYAMAMRINQWYTKDWEERAERRSISAFFRYRLKRAVEYMIDFDDRAVFEAVHERGLDGMICGHVHRAEQKLIGPFWYINDGDWVGNCTALVEGWDGALQLIRWKQQMLGLANQSLEKAAAEVA